MSGGAFNYEQRNLTHELFGLDLFCDYGEEGHKQSRAARIINPMKDREVSELVWDVLCLIHSLDWCESGDTDEDTYREDLKWFKEKWFNRSKTSVVESYKKDINEFFDEIMGEINLLEEITKKE